MVLNHRLGTDSIAAEKRRSELKKEDGGRAENRRGERSRGRGKKGGVERGTEGGMEEQAEERPGDGRKEKG